jgi:hypothetical protein
MNPWTRLTLDTWRLAWEANAVIAQRTLMLACGGAEAQAEAGRMVAEKIDAGLALQAMAFTGALGATPQQAARKTLAHYRRKVRANRRRLAGGA